jgi:hypothetical protein
MRRLGKQTPQTSLGMARSAEHSYMLDNGIYVCAACGSKKSADQIWFLLSESCWGDQLRILYWHDELAQRHDICRACSPPHVQELVVRWMTKGTLGHPMAKPSEESGAVTSGFSEEIRKQTEPERLVAEIAVHRESLARALETNILCLAAMLDELWEALNQHVSSKSSAPTGNADNILSLVREM